MPINVPTLMTWARIVLIPLVFVYYLPISTKEANLIATVAFAVAGITDFFDGWLARKLNQTSAFGAFLDPVADKLMVAASLVMLVQLDRVESYMAFIIVGREITISALREWMASMGTNKSVAVNFIGKLKTTAQMLAIPMLLYHEPIKMWNVQFTGMLLMWIAVVLTIWSMVYYFSKALPDIVRADRQE